MVCHRFLKMSQDNKGLGKDQLKFVKTFTIGIQNQDTTRVGSTEDWYQASYILAQAGTPWDSFKTPEDAMEACKHLVQKNADELGHEFQAAMDEKFPQYSKFWMVYGKGKEKFTDQVVTKNLEQNTNLANLQQLEMAKSAMEIIGFQPEALSGSQASIENAHAEDLKKQIEILKQAYLFWEFLQTRTQETISLKGSSLRITWTEYM